MENRQDNDSIRPDPVNDRVRELPDERLAGVSIDHGLRLGCCRDPVEGGLNAVRELDPQAGLSSLIPVDGLVELGPGFSP